MGPGQKFLRGPVQGRGPGLCAGKIIGVKGDLVGRVCAGVEGYGHW